MHGYRDAMKIESTQWNCQNPLLPSLNAGFRIPTKMTFPPFSEILKSRLITPRLSPLDSFYVSVRNTSGTSGSVHASLRNLCMKYGNLPKTLGWKMIADRALWTLEDSRGMQDPQKVAKDMITRLQPVKAERGKRKPPQNTRPSLQGVSRNAQVASLQTPPSSFPEAK